MKFLREAGLLLLAACLWLPHIACGDYYRPVANPVISPGGQPQTTHYAWVLNFNPNGAGSTTEIDVSGDSVLAVNAMGAGSISEAFPGSALSLFVANRDNDTVSEYLPTLQGAVTTISLLPGSRPVFVSSAQDSAMYVLNSGFNSACPSSGSISTIPTASLAVSNTTCVGMNPIAMVQSTVNNYIYIINQGDGTVSVFNPGSGVVGTINAASGLGATPVSITTSVGGNYIFIVTQGNGTSPGALNIVPAGSSSVAASVPLGVLPTYAVVDANLNRLYVANSADNTVSIFDTSSINTSGSPAIPLLGTAAVGTDPIGITPLSDGSRFYVANAGSNDVTVVSASSFVALTSVPLPSGANPVWIASDPTATKVYVADQGISATSIIQTSNNTITQNVASPAQVSTCTSSCALQQPLQIVTY